jgi:hypothetical protein
MGLLDGTIPSYKILGITASAVFMNEVFGYWNDIKGKSTLLVELYQHLAGDFFPVITIVYDSYVQRLLDLFLRLYPVRRRRDISTSTACHRTTFNFGILWNHDHLDHETHENIHTFFTGVYTRQLKHPVNMGRKGMCLDNQFQPLMTLPNLENLRNVPILFISGTENDVFSPESTLWDYEMLRRHFGEELYRRLLVESYGRLDPIIGKDAAEDVYWRVFEHTVWCNKNSLVGARDTDAKISAV